jgi:hypothetical protein
MIIIEGCRIVPDINVPKFLIDTSVTISNWFSIIPFLFGLCLWAIWHSSILILYLNWNFLNLEVIVRAAS